MFFKSIFFLLLFFTYSFSSYEKVKIGKIDSYYYDKITKDELINIVHEIEDIFETQLGFNVFDYAEDGKPIDLLYMPPSQARNDLNKSLESSKSKKEKLTVLKESLITKQEKLHQDQDELQQEFNLLNKDINIFNRYAQKIQKQQISSRTRLEQVKKEFERKKQKLNRKKDLFLQKKTKYNTLVKKYNQFRSNYNTQIKQFNRLQRKIELLSRNLKEVKGVAKGYTQTILEVYVKDGKKYTTKKKKNYMEKIEIYDFDNLAQLKTVLAHELAHLVGVGHVHSNGALMNPILQGNQIRHLWLSEEDIEEFKKSF